MVDENGQPKVKTFTIPTLAKPSIYHEPPSLATLALTETSLLRYHSDEPILITIGPLPQVVSINSQNRMSMLAFVMNIYNSDIGSMSPKSRKTLCQMASRLTKTGFDNLGYEETLQLNDSMSSTSSRGSGFAGRRSISFIKEPRISLNPGFLLEVVHAVYFTMFNGEVQAGIHALEDIHLRASFELYCDVLLVTNAIQNSLRYNPSGQPQDGPMGISIALSPTQGNPAFSKHAITNASFRTKKLPEDIDVPEDSSEATGETDQPPQYDDAISQEGASVSSGAPPSDKSGLGGKLGKPLRSIMKKSSERSKEKREKLDIKKRDSVDTHSPKSPKHSVSLSAGLGSTASYNNGDVTDPGMVNVQVVRSSSRTMVDSFEMKEGKKSTTMSAIPGGATPGGAGNGHKTSASMPEEGYTDEELDGNVTNYRPLLASHSKDHARQGALEENETNGSVNTQL